MLQQKRTVRWARRRAPNYGEYERQMNCRYYRFWGRLYDKWSMGRRVSWLVARVKGHRWIGQHVVHISKFEKEERWVQYSPEWAPEWRKQK